MIPDLPEHIIQNLKLFTGDIFLFLVTIPLIFLKLTYQLCKPKCFYPEKNSNYSN